MQEKSCVGRRTSGRGKLKRVGAGEVIVRATEWRDEPSGESNKGQLRAKASSRAVERLTSFAHLATFLVSGPPILVLPALSISPTQGLLNASLSWPLGNASARSPSNPMAARRMGSVRSWSVRVR